jgi:hypothetical protein
MRGIPNLVPELRDESIDHYREERDDDETERPRGLPWTLTVARFASGRVEHERDARYGRSSYITQGEYPRLQARDESDNPLDPHARNPVWIFQIF